MYPPRYRLVAEKDFILVKKKGKGFFCPYFSLYFLRDRLAKSSKIGFIVSNKVGKATLRNRIKRRLREIFHPWLKSEINYLMVVVGKKKCIGASGEELIQAAAKGRRFFRL